MGRFGLALDPFFDALAVTGLVLAEAVALHAAYGALGRVLSRWRARRRRGR